MITTLYALCINGFTFRPFTFHFVDCNRLLSRIVERQVSNPNLSNLHLLVLMFILKDEENGLSPSIFSKYEEGGASSFIISIFDHFPQFVL